MELLTVTADRYFPRKFKSPFPRNPPLIPRFSRVLYVRKDVLFINLFDEIYNHMYCEFVSVERVNFFMFACLMFILHCTV